MPKLTHEAIVRLVRNAPALVGYLLDRDQRLPPCSIHISQNEFIDLNHAEYRADDVLLDGDDPGAPVRVRVVEIQLGIDPDKPDRWQLHVSGLRVRYRCPVDIVVIALAIDPPDLPGYAVRIRRS